MKKAEETLPEIVLIDGAREVLGAAFTLLLVSRLGGGCAGI